jgi:hypothetical protein
VVLTDKKSRSAATAALAHIDELLDDALKTTFPASDPAAISIERGADERERLRVRGKSGGVEVLRVCIAAAPESLMNFLLTPDRRGESVIMAYSLMSNRAVGLPNTGVPGHVRL